MYAVIRVRGTSGINPRIRKGLESLRLLKPNHCVIIKDSETSRGMLMQVKDYVAWGEVSPEAVKKLVEKRGLGAKESEAEKIVFRLSPPRKGHERGGIKKSFVQGGALGYRGGKIVELLEKMM